MHTRIDIFTYESMCPSPACTFSHTHTFIHTYIPAYTHMYTYANTNIHVHI